jgi:hypothetical protein
LRALVLSAAAVFPAALTGTAVWLLTPWAPATAGDVAAAVASAVLAFLGWAGLALLAARTRPERAKWTPEETAALYDTRGLRRVLDAAPRRGRR